MTEKVAGEARLGGTRVYGTHISVQYHTENILFAQQTSLGRVTCTVRSPYLHRDQYSNVHRVHLLKRTLLQSGHRRIGLIRLSQGPGVVSPHQVQQPQRIGQYGQYCIDS